MAIFLLFYFPIRQIRNHSPNRQLHTQDLPLSSILILTQRLLVHTHTSEWLIILALSNATSLSADLQFFTDIYYHKNYDEHIKSYINLNVYFLFALKSTTLEAFIYVELVTYVICLTNQFFVHKPPNSTISTLLGFHILIVSVSFQITQ